MVQQIENAVASGYREIAIAGVHLGSYGRDLNGSTSLTTLVRTLAGWDVDVLFRISSLEPMDCTPAIVDIVAVPTMIIISVRSAEPLAIASSHDANRRASPVLVTACASTNMTSTKKNTGLMKLVNAVPSGASPSIGWATSVSTAVIAIGRASVTQSTRATANSAPVRWPAAVSSGGAGRARRTLPNTSAATIGQARAPVRAAGTIET